MPGFLKDDSPIGRALGIAIDFFWLTLLWLLCSLPIITSGASTSALYYTTTKVIHRGEGKHTQEFFRSFKVNFKQATALWFVLVISYACIGLCCVCGYNLSMIGVFSKVYIILSVVFVSFFVTWSLYLYPYIARFRNSLSETFSNCFKIMVLNPKQSLGIFAVFVASLEIIWFFPIALLFVPAAYMWTIGFLLEKVFKKYLLPPERDIDTGCTEAESDYK